MVALLEDGHLSAGHGRVLLMLDDQDMQYGFARKALEEEMSVLVLQKQVSAKLKQLRGNDDPEPDEEEQRELAKLERARGRVADALGLEEVKLKLDSEGRKRLNLVFETEASWKRFLARLKE